MDKRSAIDLVDLVCGAQIGRGEFRTVFEHRINPEYVIKYDNKDNRSNVFEYAMWQELEFESISQWLAPTPWISPDGSWLIQRRTEPIRRSELPAKVPAIFCDLKLENWGMLDGKPVCHDYGNSMLFVLARSYGSRLKRANWRDD